MSELFAGETREDGGKGREGTEIREEKEGGEKKGGGQEGDEKR